MLLNQEMTLLRLREAKVSTAKNASTRMPQNVWHFKMAFEKTATRKPAAINKTTLKRFFSDKFLITEVSTKGHHKLDLLIPCLLLSVKTYEDETTYTQCSSDFSCRNDEAIFYNRALDSNGG